MLRFQKIRRSFFQGDGKNIGCCLLAVLVPKVSIFDACACQYRLCALEMLLVVIFHHRHLKELEGLLRISGTPCIVWQNKFLQIKYNQSTQIFLLTFKKFSPNKIFNTFLQQIYHQCCTGTSSRSFKWLPVTSISSICFPIATTLLQGLEPSSFISRDVGGRDPSNEMGLVC